MVVLIIREEERDAGHHYVAAVRKRGLQDTNRLCNELGLRAFDKRLMAQVCFELGLSESEIVDYSEDEYRQRGFFEALFRRVRPMAEVSSWMGGRTEGYGRQVRILDEARAIELIRISINATYERGNTLVIGRGGQAILEGKPGVLHVRIVAPFEQRVENLLADNMTAAQARRLIEERDQATREYLATFYHIDVDDPTLYHMVLNTAALGIDKCVTLIKVAAQETIVATG